MNEMDEAMGDRLVGPNGTLIVLASGAIGAFARDHGGGVRPAAAGDGFAADLADAVRAGDASLLGVTSGSVVVVRSGAAPVRPDISTRSGDRERVIAADMTNWSVVVEGCDGDAVDVVKVVGTWGGADRAARQLARIAERGVSIIPPFVGRLDWEHPERGTSTIALVSSLITDADDGWTWAVDDVLAFAGGGAEPQWPARIGALAAEMHGALLSFRDVAAPTPTGTAIRARAEAALYEALRITDGPAGVRLRNRAEAIRSSIAGIPDHSSSPAFDLHGDFHVGQVLRAPASGMPSGHDYWVIDFDGDPQLEPGERDRPDFSARDIAHMLTSIEMVGAAAMQQVGSALPLIRSWADRAGAQLLATYRTGIAAASIGDSFDERLLDGFIAEQLLREFIYADRYLPHWQYAPDAVITHRYPPTSGRAFIEEEPWTPPVFMTT